MTNYEVVAANALRRGLRAGERVVVPRVDDLDALAASSGGKIEIESLDEGREGAVFDNLVKSAVLTVFKSRVAPEQTRDIVTAFEEGVIAHTGEDIASSDLAGLVESVPALRAPVSALTEGDESPAAVAAAVDVRARGPAPVEAPEQGHVGHERDVPQPQLTLRQRTFTSGYWSHVRPISGPKRVRGPLR